MVRRIINFASVLTLTMFIFAGCSNSSEETTVEEMKGNGKIAEKSDPQSFPQAPDFELQDLQGNVVRLSDFSGNVIILDFWATWCPPCKAEIPGFIKLYDEYKDQGLEIIGIAADQGGQSVVQQFANEYGINYPILMYTMKVVSDYGGIRGIPTTFIINKDGQVVNKFVGYRDESVFRKEIERWLTQSSD
jgi:peroxiredoxin